VPGFVLSDADRFFVGQMLADFQHYTKQLDELRSMLNEFAKSAPIEKKKLGRCSRQSTASEQ
jgi:hypothetical protein